MASNVTTQGQEAVVCDLCQNPVSFFCRRCGVSLCDPCVLLHLCVKSKFGHDVVDYASKDDNEFSVFCKTCDLPIWEHKLHDQSELSVKVEEVLKNITPENILLQSFRQELEALLEPAQIQKFLKREVEEKKEGLTRMCLFFSILLCFSTIFVIHENSKDVKNEIQNHFGNIKRMLETKFYILERRFVPDPDSGKKVLEMPPMSSVIDTGFGHIIKDLAVTDDQKVWIGGNKEMNLIDLQGHLHRTVSTTCSVRFICMYNKQLFYTDSSYNSVRKITDDDTEMTMFTTGDWEPYGITETAFGDLLVCLSKGDQSKVVRYSGTGTVLQEIQYDSQCQPLYQDARYIAENVNGDIIVTDLEKNITFTDIPKHKVIAVDKFGIFRYIYTGRHDMLWPAGVATDSVGHVYITDTILHVIHMLDRDGGFLRCITLDTEIIKFPFAISMIGDSEMILGELSTVKRIKLLEQKKDIND